MTSHDPAAAPAAPSDGRPAGHLAAVAAVAGAAFLFGTTFVVVKDAVETAGPVPFLAVRFLVGAAVLAPFALRHRGTSTAWRDGTAAGLALAVAYVLQTVGLQWTTASASAFITYLLVVIVPLLVAVRARRLPRPATSAGVALAVAGLALLTGAGVGLGRGEVLTLGCAVAFAVHILVLARAAPRHPVTLLTFVQAAVVALVLAGPGLAAGGYDLGARAWFAALYTGAAVTAGAFALQVHGQRRLGPTTTALVLMLEPVFAVAVATVSGEHLGVGAAVGGVLILAGVALAEAPAWSGRRRRRRAVPTARPPGSTSPAVAGPPPPSTVPAREPDA